jgi:hypothetical protein
LNNEAGSPNDENGMQMTNNLSLNDEIIMFDALLEYSHNGIFEFKIENELSEVCNAAKNAGGVYLVYKEIEDIENLIYIGMSGKIKQDGTYSIRKDGGIYGRLVNGNQFNGKRRRTWPKQMKTDKIDKLIIHWYVTLDKATQDIPAYVEGLLLQSYFSIYGKLPAWHLSY